MRRAEEEKMPTVINMPRTLQDKLPQILCEIFPSELYSAVCDICNRGYCVDEVRIRVGRHVCVTSAGKNIQLPVIMTRQSVDIMVDTICECSLYAHADTINQGYITLSGGIRVGLVGRASVCDGRIIGVYEISGLCLRIPRRITGVGGVVCELLKSTGKGVLVYSPPGQGKTTLLRSVVSYMASGENALRVCVIDSRAELGFALEEEGLSVDVLTGYPRPLGIEICARSMNAELIVCDEIGTIDEAEAIIAAQNCGVPLLATAHASSLSGLLRRTGIRLLDAAGVFGAYVGILRVPHQRDYKYTVDMAEGE